MAKIKIGKTQEYCRTHYSAELVGFLPEGGSYCIMGLGDTIDDAMYDLKRSAQWWIGQVVDDAINYYYATDGQEEARKMLAEMRGERDQNEQ